MQTSSLEFSKMRKHYFLARALCAYLFPIEQTGQLVEDKIQELQDFLLAIYTVYLKITININ